jgi:bromodomain-containing protein 7/9
MDENSQSFSPFYSQPESSKPSTPKPASSGLTLVIPSLKSLKASQNANKPKSRAGSNSRSASVFQDVDNQEKKIQRPIKLKPLKEVLVKLIAQLKKLVKLLS